MTDCVATSWRVDFFSWPWETRSYCHGNFRLYSPHYVSLVRYHPSRPDQQKQESKRSNIVLLYLLRGLIGPAVFFTIGITDGGISLYFNSLFLFSLLAANDGRIDSVYEFIGPVRKKLGHQEHVR
jgi:hypothetical protein